LYTEREKFAMTSSLSRRTLIKGATGSALLTGVGMPAIVKAQADAIRIGHLTPLTGFLQGTRRRGKNVGRIPLPSVDTHPFFDIA
jgi:hypothetical protein